MIDQHAGISGITTDISNQGWSVCRDFVAPADIDALRARLRAWWDEGELRPAGIGRGDSFQLRSDIRTDYVRWLDFHSGGQFHDVMQRYFEPLRLAINQALMLGIFEFEAHVTVYPPGAFYRRHVDQFQDVAHRKLSAILYLNDHWQAEDGGQLRLYLPQADGSEMVHDVFPEAGTLVTFLSHEIPHEVLPTRRERLSLTGWFRTRT